MKIVHLSNTPLSNSPSNLAKIQRDVGHDSRALLHRQANTNKIFVGGELWQNMDHDQLTNMFEDADVVHFHNFGWTQQIFKHHPHLIEIVKEKKCLIQYHSPRQGLESFEDTLKDTFFDNRRAVVAQYQTRLYPEANFIVPNVLPIFDDMFKPIPSRDWGQPVISYAPSNTNLRGWDDKGFSKIMPILKRGRRLTVDIITNTPYEETMLRKKWATIGLEEVVTGSYHLSFLEYLAFGCATIGNLDDPTKKAMAAVVGIEAVAELPYIQTDIQSLPETLNEIFEMGQTYGERARTWMETHWNPNTLVKYFDDIYAKL